MNATPRSDLPKSWLFAPRSPRRGDLGVALTHYEKERGCVIVWVSAITETDRLEEFDG